MGSSLIAIQLLAFLLPAAQTGPEQHPRVFAGARGFGVRGPAGRGGRIIRVTNLNAAGPGSLREALAAHGSRIAVFEVGGVIDLQGRGIVVSEPFLTIAGQTAPSPGITLVRGSILIKTHDVLIRHLRVRPGTAAPRGDWETAIGAWGPEAFNIVVDHCSVSWAAGENFLAGGPIHDGPTATARNVTFSNSIVSESLYDGNRRSPRGSGMLVYDGCTNVAVIGNLFAHNYQRNPGFRANTTAAVANNVIYDPGRSAVQLEWVPTDWTGRPVPRNPRVSIVGNVLLYGGDTSEGLPLVSRKGDAFMSDNAAYDLSGTPAAVTAGLIHLLSERPAWPPRMRALPAAKTLAAVLRSAGARPRDRDPIDKRVVAEVHDRKGRLIASQDEAGGYPKSAVPARRRLVIPAEDLEQWLEKLAADVE